MSVQFKFKGSIRERDIDLILMQELAVSQDLVDMFLSHENIRHKGGIVLEVLHSATKKDGPGKGESDLTVIYEYAGKKYALLIEDKIDANPQEEQYERYLARGEDGVHANKYSSFNVFLICPKRYYEKKHKYDNRYDKCISYEEFLDFFQEKANKGDVRAQYYVDLFKRALRKYERTSDIDSAPEWLCKAKSVYINFYEEYNNTYGNGQKVISLISDRTDCLRHDDLLYRTNADSSLIKIFHTVWEAKGENGKIKLMFREILPKGADNEKKAAKLLKVRQYVEKFLASGSIEKEGLIIRPAQKSISIECPIPRLHWCKTVEEMEQQKAIMFQIFDEIRFMTELANKFNENPKELQKVFA